jgi:hypothetical protein
MNPRRYARSTDGQISRDLRSVETFDHNESASGRRKISLLWYGGLVFLWECVGAEDEKVRRLDAKCSLKRTRVGLGLLSKHCARRRLRVRSHGPFLGNMKGQDLSRGLAYGTSR